MDDRFMSSMRRDPDPDYARRLRARLRAEERPAGLPALRPALGWALAAAVVASLFAFPSVRASAQAVLDLFRVRNFAAVEFDESRLERLRALETDNALLVFDRQETLRDPGPAVHHASLASASAAAGLDLRSPGMLPRGLAADSVFVTGEGAARLSVSEARLRGLLDALDLRDVVVPRDLDGKIVEVRKPPVVVQRFAAGRWKATLVQARSPELSVPAGLEIERLAEIGLRVLGLDPGEARRIAQGTDWRSTMLVPVPASASTFRHVTVRGARGLLVTTKGERDGDGDRHRNGNMLMWTEGDRVFALVGNLPDDDTLQMAESLR